MELEETLNQRRIPTTTDAAYITVCGARESKSKLNHGVHTYKHILIQLNYIKLKKDIYHTIPLLVPPEHVS